jgi:cytosine/adenosine deaminase-related metal-dependent hydrolase
MLVGADGRIEAVGLDQEVPRPSDAPADEFQDAILLPGLINTHTHLELTGLEGRVAEPDFSLWIRRLREVKSTRRPEDYMAAARQGLAECYAAGVTTVADTGDSGAVLPALVEADGSGIVYQEVFGPDPSQLDESMKGLRLRVRELSRLATRRVRVGVSPHAAYTVSGALFREVAAWSRSERLPLAVHVAESRAETQFLQSGSGPFAQAWRDRRIPLPESQGSSPIAWLEKHNVLSPMTLCIHAVQAGAEDILRLARAGSAVAHCPLSNRAHGHGTAPVAAMLKEGVRVGLGTDSVVSVGRLDLLAEARLAGELIPLGPEQQLELCTLGGARALSLAAELGSLEAGKWADCAVVLTSRGAGGPEEKVMKSAPDQVLRTYIGGKEVFRRP